ncbi:MAG: hypothetical protein HKN23_22130 [Verrucomicrobiales bacterium]|nr:hypothetical protein [Verrucomicrobiales bacterium]
MTRHEWRDRTEDGEIRYLRANHHAGEWLFQSRLKSESEWTRHGTTPPLEDLVGFREVLWNKHQRRRVHQDHLDQIDDMIEARKAEIAAGDGAGEEE